MRSDFEKTLKQHRDALTDELEKLGKHRQVQLVEWDIERNESDYEFYFNSAWNVQQSKIDELQKLRGLDEMAINQIAHANQQWQLKCDDLQKRIDAAQQLIEDLNECYQQDHQNKFEYWRGFSHSAGISAKRLEQALKGESND